MKLLEKIVLVQFFVCDAEEIDIHGHTAFLGQNGAGKTSLLDAVQIVMQGADRRYLQFNAKKTAKENRRNIRDYCLGFFKSGASESEEGEASQRRAVVRHKRDSAHTYITLVFRDQETNIPISAGVAITAHVDDQDHHVKGLYVVNGLALGLSDHVERQGEDSYRPLKWKEFEMLVRHKADKMGATVEVNGQPEKHVRAMLHALQPKGAAIDPVEYQKTFKKSINLSDIDNVSDFVRDFLIEEERIEKKQAMAQIIAFRELQKKIDDVQDQIRGLVDIENKFRNVLRNEQRLAAIKALSAIYRVEEAAVRFDDVSENLESSEGKVKTKQEEIDRLDADELRIGGDFQEVSRQLDNDPSARELEALTLRLGSERTRRDQIIVAMKRVLEPLHGALHQLASLLPTPAARKSAEQGQLSLEATEEGLTNGDIDLAVELGSLASKMSSWRDALLVELKAAEENEREASRFYEEEFGSIQNLRRGGIDLKGPPALALSALQRAGIESRPVCECVGVTDISWQAAIEAALGDQRLALLVSDAALAVDILEKAGINDATVIQPDHLKNTALPGPTEVAALIEGSDPAAVAFVQEALHGLRMSASMDEALAHGQALTQNGLLCRDGGAILLSLNGMPVLGLQRIKIDEATLTRRLDGALAAKSSASIHATKLRTAFTSVDSVNISQMSATIGKDGLSLKLCVSAIEGIQELMNAVDTGSSEALRERKTTLKATLGGISLQSRLAVEALGKLKEKVSDLEKALEAARVDGVKAAELQAQALASQDYLPSMVDELRAKLDVDGMGREVAYVDRLLACNERYERYVRNARELDRAAFDAFTPFVNRFGYEVIDERSDWRKALKWAEVTRAFLVETRLAEYEGEARTARLVAENSFRKDVALRLKEGINRMETNIREINRLLDLCPPFSNNEKFRFKAWVAPVHKNLHAFIMNADKDEGTEDLLRSSTYLDDEVLEMLVRGSMEGAEKTPLDDFRLMFNFDLMISDSVHTTALSKRIGTGSNGEHRTPFYVIAAAALAHAFRIDDHKKQRTGTALMLMDEAFSDMDGTNATAAAKFISSLGIQTLMAAPSEAKSKFLGFTDTVFELDRFNEDLFFHREELTEKAHALMRSDMPSEHPELLETKVAEYTQHAADRQTSA